MVLPTFISFVDWAASVTIDYPGAVLDLYPEEANWKEWAHRLCESDIFTQVAVPSPEAYDNWRDWAMNLVGVAPPAGS